MNNQLQYAQPTLALDADQIQNQNALQNALQTAEQETAQGPNPILQLLGMPSP